MGSNSTMMSEQAQDAAERELAQTVELPEATKVFGNPLADKVVIPSDYKPRGPTPAELRGRELLREVMEVEDRADDPPPPLYPGSENDS